MSVEVTGTASTFDHGSPRALFPTRVTWLENQAMGRHYAPSRDGQRFLIASTTRAISARPILDVYSRVCPRVVLLSSRDRPISGRIRAKAAV